MATRELTGGESTLVTLDAGARLIGIRASVWKRITAQRYRIRAEPFMPDRAGVLRRAR